MLPTVSIRTGGATRTGTRCNSFIHSFIWPNFRFKSSCTVCTCYNACNFVIVQNYFPLNPKSFEFLNNIFYILSASKYNTKNSTTTKLMITWNYTLLYIYQTVRQLTIYKQNRISREYNEQTYQRFFENNYYVN